MCLIIVKPANVKVSARLIRRASGDNPHGFGVAWAQGGECHAIKGASVTIAAQKAVIKAITPYPAIIHWRWATHGGVSVENTHPFILADGGYLVHNGVLHGFGGIDQSDTAEFVNLVMSTYSGPRDIASDRQYLEKLIVGSRIATIHPSGRILRLGRVWSKMRSGLILSNTHSLPISRNRRTNCDMCGRHVLLGSRVYGAHTWRLCAACIATIETDI